MSLSTRPSSSANAGIVPNGFISRKARPRFAKFMRFTGSTSSETPPRSAMNSLTAKGLVEKAASYSFMAVGLPWMRG